MMIQVNIEENEDGKYKLTWQLRVRDNFADPQESLHSTYDEAGQKALVRRLCARCTTWDGGRMGPEKWCDQEGQTWQLAEKGSPAWPRSSR